MTDRIKITIINNITSLLNYNIFLNYPFKDTDCHSGKIDNLDFKIFSYHYDSILYRIQLWQLCNPSKYKSLVNEYFIDSDSYILIIKYEELIEENFFDKYRILFSNNNIFLLVVNLDKNIIDSDNLINTSNLKGKIITFYEIITLNNNTINPIIKTIIKDSIALKNNDLFEIDLEEDENDFLIRKNYNNKIKNKWKKIWQKIRCC
jgi:hypothetical protein